MHTPVSFVHAEVFYAQDEALKLAFPETQIIEKKTLILDKSELKYVQDKAKTIIESSLFTFYVGKVDGNIIGYAAIDSHTVRTQTATYMVVLNENGEIKKVVVLAFNEPLEYITSTEWNNQFIGKDRSHALIPGQDIQGIAGSTLSVNAISIGVRKILALYELLIKR